MSFADLGSGSGIGTVVQLWNLARNTPDQNSTISAQIRAARQAGFDLSRPQMIAVGQGIISQAAFRAGQGGGPGSPDRGPGVAANQPPPARPPSDFEILIGAGNPKNPPPPPPKGPAGAPVNPNAPILVPGLPPWVYGAAILWPIIKEGAGWIYGENQRDRERIKREEEVWRAQGGRGQRNPRGRKRRPPKRQPQQEGRGDPFPDKKQPARRAEPVWLPDTIIVPRGRMRDPMPNRTVGQAEAILTAPVAVPVPPKPLWQQLLPLALPLVGPLVGLLSPSAAAARVNVAAPAAGGNPFPLTGSYPAVQTSAAFGPPGTPGTNTCECKAPRKKRPKKKRTVCYSGTFIERADGTRKSKKRKVKCL